ncbi:hypothetical protein [Nocardia sp. Marseille-Q1738]
MAIKARVLPPTDDGFVMLAGEVGSWRGPFASAPVQLAARLEGLAAGMDAFEANVFRAVLRPPGEGDEVLAAKGLRPARFDVVVLIRTASVEAAHGAPRKHRLQGTRRARPPAVPTRSSPTTPDCSATWTTAKTIASCSTTSTPTRLTVRVRFTEFG